MTGTVVDASVVVLAAMGDGAALELLATCEQLHAPELMPVEVLNALRRIEHTGELDAADVGRAAESLGRMAIRLHGHAGLLAGAWSARHNLSAYDGCYLALAARDDLRLATADRGLVRAARELLGSGRVTDLS